MESIREVTARGGGHWGYHAFDVELATRTTTWTDSIGTRTRTLHRYELRIPVRAVGTRSWSTEEERQAFIRQSFSDLTVRRLRRLRRDILAHPLASLVGQRLDSVEFVADWAQLGWGTKGLNVYALAYIENAQGRTEHDAPEYPDRLRGLVGQELIRVDELLDRGLVLTFADGIDLVIPLGPDADIHEAAEGPNGAIWYTGEPPFE